MFFVEIIELEGLGNRSYLAGGWQAAVAVDPPRDVDRVLAAAARRGVRISHVVETHVHNDYVTGGLELARITGADYLVPAGARVAYERIAVGDGDTVEVDAGLTLTAVATPGHTPHHTAYVLSDDGRPAAVFTGGSLLIGTVGRPDLVEPRLTEHLARAQHTSARRLADTLPDDTTVLPTHGFGSFCSSAQADGKDSTIGKEKAGNTALITDVDTFVADLLAGLEDVPAYYTHMGPINAAGPAPVNLTTPGIADPQEIEARLAAGEWIVDLRNRVAFADGHVAGSYNFEADGSLAAYLAWMIPWGRPVTLLAESAGQLAAAQRELVRVGIDRPAAAATGGPERWVRDGQVPVSFRRSSFAALAEQDPEGIVVLDVRRDSERAQGWIRGSVHIPVHHLHRRADEVPEGTVWVHCAAGMRAAIAASLLHAAGRDVVAVDDAFHAATQAGRTITTDCSQSPVPPRRRSRTSPGPARTTTLRDDHPREEELMSPHCFSEQRLSVREAHDRTAADQEARLLDVRETTEWAAGHAPGAVHAPLSGLAAGGTLPPPARGRPLVVICRSGQRSQRAAALLAQQGADTVDVEGGMNAWAAAGFPVVDEHGNTGSIA